MNFNLSLGSLLGIIDVFLAIGIFATSIGLTLSTLQQQQKRGMALFYIIQGIVSPIFLFLAGLIFLFQGWRLDPTLAFAVLLLHIIIGISILKDIVLVSRNRQS